MVTYIGTVEDWTAPSLLNNWVNYSAAYNPAGYFKDKFGIVHLRGLVKDGDGIGASYPVFNLPAGYRPTYNEICVITSNSAFGHVNIETAGNIIITVGSTTWVCFDGITFRAA